jgi:cytochrome P450
MLRFQYYPVLPVDIHLGEYQIEAGQALLLWLASANRDEAHFPIPRRSRAADSLIGT